MKSKLHIVISILLIISMSLIFTSCKEKVKKNNDVSVSSSVTALGEGSREFIFTVVTADGNEKTYNIKTDEITVGEALSSLKLIDGENGAYGLYVKTVDSVTYDYDKDGKYWAFYINGEYASSGVDKTEIKQGDRYMFKAE